MRRLFAALCVVSSSVMAAADEPATESNDVAATELIDVAATIDRGLAFLTKDALAWKAEHNCASCHHASLVVWAMREGKARGHVVDETVLAELTTWLTQAGDGKTAIPRPEAVPKAANERPVHFSLALAANPEPDTASLEGLARLLATVKEDQMENGSWASWPETRPPIFGASDERLTLEAVLALLPAAKAGDEAAIGARDRGVRWLEETESDDDPQSVALRVVLWQRLGRPAEEIAPLVARIRERQNADGGWSQTAEMASDAWATGQALYALAHAGGDPADEAVRRGQEFLVRTQREDGSWAMTSRPTKPDDTSQPGVIPITGAGAAWAVMGLSRSR